MPTYLFEHPDTGQVIEIQQSMSEEHEYIDSNGLKWIRLFCQPQASIKDKKIDIRHSKDRELYNSVYKKRYEYNQKKGKIDKNGKLR